MSKELKNLESEIQEKLINIKYLRDLNTLKAEVFGKKGLITLQLKSISNLPENERKDAGREINNLKNKINNLFEEKNKILSEKEVSSKLQTEKIDITLPVRPDKEGKINPITQTIAEVSKIFQKMGFDTALGPDIEDDFHNFTACFVKISC